MHYTSLKAPPKFLLAFYIWDMAGPVEAKLSWSSQPTEIVWSVDKQPLVAGGGGVWEGAWSMRL